MNRRDYDEFQARLPAEAVCRNTPGLDTPGFFFPAQEEFYVRAKEIWAICGECPLRLPCLEYGMDELYGYYGGISPRDRQRLRKKLRHDREWYGAAS